VYTQIQTGRFLLFADPNSEFRVPSVCLLRSRSLPSRRESARAIGEVLFLFPYNYRLIR
jgi:hypothetical protein